MYLRSSHLLPPKKVNFGAPTSTTGTRRWYFVDVSASSTTCNPTDATRNRVTDYRMFKLDPFILGRDEAGALPGLESVRPRFQLPDLEECESSVNRLLDGLKFRPTFPGPSRHQKHLSPKGKEREMPSGEEQTSLLEDDGANGVSFWMEAGENVPGPSKGRLFQVSDAE